MLINMKFCIKKLRIEVGNKNEILNHYNNAIGI